MNEVNDMNKWKLVENCYFKRRKSENKITHSNAHIIVTKQPRWNEVLNKKKKQYENISKWKKGEKYSILVQSNNNENEHKIKLYGHANYTN